MRRAQREQLTHRRVGALPGRVDREIRERLLTTAHVPDHEGHEQEHERDLGGLLPLEDVRHDAVDEDRAGHDGEDAAADPRGPRAPLLEAEAERAGRPGDVVRHGLAARQRDHRGRAERRDDTPDEDHPVPSHQASSESPYPTPRSVSTGMSWPSLARSLPTHTSTTLLPGSKSRCQTSWSSSSLWHTWPARRMRCASRLSSRSVRAALRALNVARRRPTSRRMPATSRKPSSAGARAAPTLRRTRAMSSVRLNGLDTTSTAPRSSASTRAPTSVTPDSTITGVVCLRSLIALSTARPLSPGITRSSTTRSTSLDASRSIAALAEAAVTTECPWDDNDFASNVRTRSSSSTTITVAMKVPPPRSVAKYGSERVTAEWERSQSWEIRGRDPDLSAQIGRQHDRNMTAGWQRHDRSLSRDQPRR